MAKVALIVPVLNGADFLAALLTSLSRHWDARLGRIHILDNHSADGTADVAADWFAEEAPRRGFQPGLSRFSQNHGFAPAVNVGLNLAREDPTITHMMVANVDQEVREEWLEWLLVAMERFPRLGMVSSTLIETGTPEEYRQRSLPEAAPGSPLQIHHRCKGCPWLYRREALEEVGLFDERFLFSQYEDSDHQVRLAQAGWEWSMVDNSPCYHHVGSRGQAAARQQSGRNFAEENRARFIAKWGTVHMDEIMPPPLYLPVG